MINVSVGDDDLLNLETVFFDEVENVFDIIAGINHHRFARSFVPDDRAVTLQRPDRKDFVNHGLASRQSSVFSRQQDPVKDC